MYERIDLKELGQRQKNVLKACGSVCLSQGCKMQEFLRVNSGFVCPDLGQNQE